MSANQDSVHPRFPLADTVIVRETAHSPAVLVQLRNISLSGCYLETPRPFAEGSRIRIILQSSKLRADVWGVVRRRDATGIGVQFTNGTTVEDWKRLESFIKQLHGDPQARAASVSQS
jgi:hypothetical protein